MLITSITAPFEIAGPQAVIESLMRNRAPAKYAAYAGAAPDNITASIGNNNVVSLAELSDLDDATFNLLTYNVVGGRLEITGLSTNNLPNGRRFWLTFGQLVEDVFFGRIPELASAKQIVIDQPSSKIFWEAMTNPVTLGGYTITNTILTGSSAKSSSDFFE